METINVSNDYWIERKWSAAIGQWFDGDADALAALIRDNSTPFSAEARAFLADLVSGGVSRGKGGRPIERDGWVERAIVAEVFKEWTNAKAMPREMRLGDPKAVACATVAERRGTTSDSIRALVDRFRRLGITREKWIAWGCPTWKNI